MIQEVFKAYGLETTLDESIKPAQVRLDMDDATFEEATRVLGMLTQRFYVPLDPHRVLVVKILAKLARSSCARNWRPSIFPG